MDESHAIRELGIFVEKNPLARWNDKSQYNSLMQKIFEEMNSRTQWEDEDLSIVKKCLNDLIYCKDYPDILNNLLPLTTEITERQINLLLQTYHGTVTRLKIAGRIKVADVLNKVNGWLALTEIENQFKEKQIPEIINSLYPGREIRPPFSRRKIESNIIITSPNDDFEFEGKTIDISENGVSFALNGKLKDYQKRKSDKKIFTLMPYKKKLSDIVITILNPNGTGIWIKTKGSICRAFDISSSPNTTGFGAAFEYKIVMGSPVT